jgi:phosphoribosylformylglycinamidine synthase
MDEAVRRLVAVGGKLDEIGGVDNFCWPSIQYDAVTNPDGRYKAAQLVRANWALRDICLAYGIPLLSGKDSMYVDGHLPGEFGERHKVSGLPTMQFTATTVVSDVADCLTMEPTAAGDLVYVLGRTADELGGSEYYELFGYTGLHVPKVNPEANLRLYETLEKAIGSGVVASCHGIYRGGLGIHAALMCFGSWSGMELDLTRIPLEGEGEGEENAHLRDDRILFSESCGRFIVTVAPALRGAFEAQFKGLPCGLAGEITEEPRLVIRGRQGRTLVDQAVSDLKPLWKQPPAC